MLQPRLRLVLEAVVGAVGESSRVKAGPCGEPAWWPALVFPQEPPRANITCCCL